MKRYLVSLGQLRGILDELYVDEITMRTIAQISRRAGISNATRRRDITAVSVVLRWCVAQNWREDNPAANWDRSIIKERRDPIILPETYDIDCVVSAAPGNFARLIRFAQYTGMRRGMCEPGTLPGRPTPTSSDAVENQDEPASVGPAR